MAELLHEIWENPEDGSLEVSRVTRQADALRLKVSPKSRLLHRFRASSYNRAMQRFHEWANFNTYIPASDGPDEEYAASEMIEQQDYLRVRRGSWLNQPRR